MLSVLASFASRLQILQYFYLQVKVWQLQRSSVVTNTTAYNYNRNSRQCSVMCPCDTQHCMLKLRSLPSVRRIRRTLMTLTPMMEVVPRLVRRLVFDRSSWSIIIPINKHHRMHTRRLIMNRAHGCPQADLYILCTKQAQPYYTQYNDLGPTIHRSLINVDCEF